MEIKGVEIKRVEKKNGNKKSGNGELRERSGGRVTGHFGRDTTQCWVGDKPQTVFRKTKASFLVDFIKKKEFLFLVLHHLLYCSILVLRNMAQVGSLHTLYFSADF